MNFDTAAVGLFEVLDFKLFQIGGTAITVASLVTFVLILAGTAVASRSFQQGTRVLLRRGGVTDEATSGALSSLVNYSTLLVGLFLALKAVGIDIGMLFTAGALFAVGFGFAMQNIAQNFVAGVILLAERSIRPGDVLSVDGAVVKVKRLGIRATIVRTRDGEDLIVPNSILVQTTVKNYTLFDAHYRVRTVVGVTYGSDMGLVRDTLASVAAGLDWRDPSFPPQVLMWEFGSSSVNYEVAVWIGDPWEARPAISRLNEAIWRAFKDRDITIAFPQLDLHLDRPALDALRRGEAA